MKAWAAMYPHDGPVCVCGVDHRQMDKKCKGKHLFVSRMEDDILCPTRYSDDQAEVSPLHMRAHVLPFLHGR
jgi:hypothetical protein